MKYIVPVLIFFGLFWAGCAQKENRVPIQEMLFEVNTDLIGEKVTLYSLGLSFHPPITWDSVDDTTLQQFQEHVQNNMDPDAPFHLEPHRVFLNPANQNMLSVSRIVTQSEMTLSHLVTQMQKQTTFDQGGRKLQRSQFLKDDIRVEQLFMQDLLRVVVKLVFQNQQGQFIEMDYTTLKTEYENESKAIESSLGTITLINK